MTPMLHLPEVMVTYETSEKVLFSADAFGTFGALNGNIFNDEINFDRDWLNDARRYYTNIVGKFGLQVQNAIKKLSTFDIEIICPLHGPIWRTNISYLLDKYQLWSTYTPEEKSVVILYGSMYGNTENAANVLAAMLADKGIKNIAVYDVSSTHVSQCISESFRTSHIVLAAPTYNGGLYPAMEHVLLDMKALNLQNRTVALLDNGSWASTASKQMKAILETMKYDGLRDQRKLKIFFKRRPVRSSGNSGWKNCRRNRGIKNSCRESDPECPCSFSFIKIPLIFLNFSPQTSGALPSALQTLDPRPDTLSLF